MHSDDGLDELSVAAPSSIATLTHGVISESSITPKDMGFVCTSLKDVIGGDVAKNARIIAGLFSGNITGSKLDIVLLNSAAGLWVAGKAPTLKEGVEIARAAIVSGRAADFFHTASGLS